MSSSFKFSPLPSRASAASMGGTGAAGTSGAEDMNAAKGDGQPAQGGYEIQIRVEADGSLSVGVSHDAGMGGGTDMGQDTGEGMQPAADIKEALTMALEIYRSNGDGPADSGAMQDEFASGFSGGGEDGTGAGGAGGMGGAPLGARV